MGSLGFDVFKRSLLGVFFSVCPVLLSSKSDYTFVDEVGMYMAKELLLPSSSTFGRFSNAARAAPLRGTPSSFGVHDVEI